jgi:hypothetical protein
MGQIVFTLTPRRFTNSSRCTQPKPKPTLSALSIPALHHPAMSYATEDLSIHESLDLSFWQDVALSRLDRQLIDDLNRAQQPLPCVERLASGF